MIYVGLDDTDIRDSRGTNQLARELVTLVADQYRCLRITRHQLLDDPRVPYTSKNGSASLVLEPRGTAEVERLLQTLSAGMRRAFVPGSDPGLGVAETVPAAIEHFGRLCQSELVRQSDAYELARRHGVHLVGLGGTNDGVIGALAAIGLAAGDNDGRVVYSRDWTVELSGCQPLERIQGLGVEVREFTTGRGIESGMVDVDKKLRPNWRQGRCVLFVAPVSSRDAGPQYYRALKLP